MEYFIACPDKRANMVSSAETKQEFYNKYNVVFSGFEGTFSLQVKEGMKPYQALPTCLGKHTAGTI